MSSGNVARYYRAMRKPCLGCGRGKSPGRGRKWCEECTAERLEVRRHRQRGNPAMSLLCRYGLTVEEYDALLEKQCGVCAICEALPPVGRLRRLSVDHDHVTGEVRGLLCQRCNMALHFLENTEWNERATAYLTPGV